MSVLRWREVRVLVPCRTDPQIDWPQGIFCFGSLTAQRNVPVHACIAPYGAIEYAWYLEACRSPDPSEVSVSLWVNLMAS